MRFSILSTAMVVAGITAASPAFATYTTVDLSGYVNSNVSINPDTYPTGPSYGSTDTGIPFFIAEYPANSGVEGTWNSGGGIGSSLTVDLTSENISGQASFYALLNNYYGTQGADEYDITIVSNNHSVTYESIGGVDTRDYNSNIYTNTIADTTTEWFNNGIGQRFDIREFTLPTDFSGDTIESFTITQVTGGDNALFSGLTFSDQQAVTFNTPEPVTLSIFGASLAGLGVMRRKRKVRSK